MKSVKLLIKCSVPFLLVLSVEAQGFLFQNLNFEQANPISTGDPEEPFSITETSGLPYWTATIGGVQQTEIYYDAFTSGAPAIALIGVGTPLISPIDGDYSVLLTGTFGVSAAISQSGLIPAGSQSLYFEANNTLDSGPPGTLEIQVGTQSVPFIAVGTGPNYTLYGANISAWANDTEPLTFSALQDNTALNNWEIDDITFSPTPLPEPSPLGLTGVGGLLFALYRGVSPKPAKSGRSAKNVR